MGWLAGYQYNLRRKVADTAGSGFTISADTISFDQSDHKILDSGDGLISIKNGMWITVSGSTSNNGVYFVKTGGVDHEIVVDEKILDTVDEAAGDTVVIVTHSIIPLIVYNSGSGDDVDHIHAANCKNFPQDIRFTADDGTTELSYWYETDASTTQKTFWIRIPADTDAADYYYRVFWGKTGALTTRSGFNVFGPASFNDFTNVSGEWSRWAGVDSYSGEHGMVKDGVAYMTVPWSSTSQGKIMIMNMADGSNNGDAIVLPVGYGGAAAPQISTAGFLFTAGMTATVAPPGTIGAKWQRWDLSSRAAATHTYTITTNGMDMECLVYDPVQDVIIANDGNGHVVALRCSQEGGNAPMTEKWVCNGDGHFHIKAWDATIGNCYGAPAVYAGHLYTTDNDGTIYKINMADGAVEAHIHLAAGHSDGYPSVLIDTDHDHVIVSFYDDKTVYCVAVDFATDDAALWSVPLVDPDNHGNTNDCEWIFYMGTYHDHQLFISGKTSNAQNPALFSKLYRIGMDADGLNASITHVASEAHDQDLTIVNNICDDDYVYAITTNYNAPGTQSKLFVYALADLALVKTYEIDSAPNLEQSGSGCCCPVGYNGKFLLGIWGTNCVTTIHDGWFQCVNLRNAGTNATDDCPWKGDVYHTGYLGAVQSGGDLVDEIYSDRWHIDGQAADVETPRFDITNSVLSMIGNSGGYFQSRKSLQLYGLGTRIKYRAKLPTDGGKAYLGAFETPDRSSDDWLAFQDVDGQLAVGSSDDGTSLGVNVAYSVGTDENFKHEHFQQGVSNGGAYAGCIDNWPNLAAPTTNYGTLEDLLVFGKATEAIRIIINFDISAYTLPSGFEQDGAILALNYYANYGLGPTGRTYRCYELDPDNANEEWSETESSWNNIRTTGGADPWVTAGGDMTATYSEMTFSATPNTFGWVKWRLSAAQIADALANHNGIVRLLIKDSVENSSTYAIFRSSEYAADTSLRPILTMQYKPLRTQYHNFGISWLSATSAKFYLNQELVTELTAAASMPDGDVLLPMRFMVSEADTELDIDWALAAVGIEPTQATSGAASFKAAGGLEFCTEF